MDLTTRVSLVQNLLTTKEIPASVGARLLDINRTSIYYKGAPISDEELACKEIMDHLHTDNPTWGARQMSAQLKTRGYQVGRRKARRYMNEMDIYPIYPKMNLSKRMQQAKVCPYLLRNAVIDKPNQAWSIDITYIPIKRGFLYLTAVIDWYSRCIVGWEMCIRDRDKGFNYPSINNMGVDESKGKYLLFLNNDTEIVNPDCISEMLSQCQRPEVGAVGARLYYEDGTIQHAGVIIGMGGVAGHAFVGFEHDDLGYFARIVLTQDYSAVTAACMMVKRDVFEEVGRFDEKYAVAFNDVDLCLKIREAGYLIVYDPYAELNHYESKSRGYEDTEEKVARFNSEVDRFQKRWKDVLQKGDPYYSPNLTLDKNDFSLTVDVR